MQSQRHLFQLPKDLHYINGAYMSPLLKSSEEAGIVGIARKRNPALLTPDHFFDDVERVKQKFGKLVNAAHDNISIIPSASYGLMNAIQNVPTESGNHAITVFEEFPSGHFALSRWCSENNTELRIIRSESEMNKCQNWNEKILDAINKDTSVVVMSAIHWMDGTLFYLDKIGKRCEDVGAYFIVDGSQSVGALPMDVKAFRIDALICAAYKWLLGPYSIGLAYYGEKYKNGLPIEESWMNRNNARNFSQLTDYNFSYRPGAQRYTVGEATNLIHMPMLEAGLDQLMDWGIDNIQSYCRKITSPLVESLKNLGITIEDDDHRAFHLFGMSLPTHIDSQDLLNKLRARKIILSIRGSSIRVSPNVYNTPEDINALQLILEETIQENK